MSLTCTTKGSMNLMSVILVAACVLLATGNAVFAEPYLQLDANPATYVDGLFFGEVESIVTTDRSFTLYALVNSDQGSTDGYFYLSGAVVPSIYPRLTPDPDLGFFTFDGATINVTSNMEYGTPPMEVLSENKDLPGHGIFETYYFEHEFTLDLDDPDKRALVYNSQDTQNGPFVASTVDPDGDLYFEDFEVDISGLVDSEFYSLHFDLYTQVWDEKKEAYVLGDKAPFSHDLTATHAPVPGAVLLGMLGLGVAGVKLRKFA